VSVNFVTFALDLGNVKMNGHAECLDQKSLIQNIVSGNIHTPTALSEHRFEAVLENGIEIALAYFCELINLNKYTNQLLTFYQPAGCQKSC